MMLDSSMETSLYPDDGCQSTSYVKMRSLKQKMTLDLDGGGPSCKRGRYGGGGLLSSPDLNMLKLGSPELESLLIQQHGHVTTTPTASGGQYSGGGYPKTVTEEQELYARGFVEALAELHQTEDYASTTEGEYLEQDQDPSSPSDTTSSCTNDYQMHGYLNHPPPPHYTDFILPINIKEEPQTVPNRETPPPHLSPIDMMAQERIKLERKRQRNRLAASKCRRRKLERIARLEDKVKILKDDNSELGNVVAKLKDHICRLKEQLMEHVNNGCQVMPAVNNEYS